MKLLIILSLALFASAFAAPPADPEEAGETADEEAKETPQEEAKEEAAEGTCPCRNAETLAIANDPRSKIQNSLDRTDLEISPAWMSDHCAGIFAPLQSEAINAKRDQCKKKYPDSTDDAQVSCKDKCILINVAFVDEKTGKVLIKPFEGGMKMVQTPDNRKMISRIVAAFNDCYERAKEQDYDHDNTDCTKPVYRQYGGCLWEMAKKLCVNELNTYSNRNLPW